MEVLTAIMPYYRHHLFICTNLKKDNKTSCVRGNSEQLFLYAKERIAELKLKGPGGIRVSKSGCLGRCDLGPSVVVYPEGIWYRVNSEEEMEQIIQVHLIKGQIVTTLLMTQIEVKP